MARPQSPKDVANLALDLCKTAPISSLNDTANDVVNICNRHGDQARRVALELHTWNFATKRVSLAEAGGEPEFGFSTWYTLPTNFIRLIGIGEDEVECEYSIEDGMLLIDELGGGELDLRYVYDHSNVPNMPALFIDVWAAAWAKRMAKALGCSNSLIKEIAAHLDEVRLEAEAIDGQQTKIKKVERSRYRSARRGFTTRRTDIVE